MLTKTRPHGASDQLPLAVSRDGSSRLQMQIINQLQQQIVNGSLPPGSKLPPIRSMAAQLKVSRNTVVLAYQRLLSEGYVETIEGVGTYVTSQLPEQALYTIQRGLGGAEKEEQLSRRHPLLFHGARHEVFSPRPTRPRIDFFVGRPDAKSFPAKTWRRLMAAKLASGHAGMTEYGDPAGLMELRTAIANHLGPARGIKADPENIVIVAGIQEALNLIARLLVGLGTKVAVENPCYQGAAFVMDAVGAQTLPIPVDEEGLNVDALPDAPVSLIYVTPSHQYPTGATLSLKRRIRLLEWAWNTGSYVIEDDYDSDFRYHDSPLFALAGLDKHGCVIYLGTFSKSIGAGIRVGYIVAPPGISKNLTTLKGLLNNGNPWLEQAVLAEFLRSGGFSHHLRKIRRVYSSRRDVLLEELSKRFGDVTLSGTEGGMHIAWTLPPELPDAVTFQHLARKEGVGIYPPNAGAAKMFGNTADYGRMVLLGFSSVTEPQIRKGMELLARVAEHSMTKKARDDRDAGFFPPDFQI